MPKATGPCAQGCNRIPCAHANPMWLQVGEFEAPPSAYEALAHAIRQPSCVLSHMYMRDPVSEHEHETKR